MNILGFLRSWIHRMLWQNLYEHKLLTSFLACLDYASSQLGEYVPCVITATTKRHVCRLPFIHCLRRVKIAVTESVSSLLLFQEKFCHVKLSRGKEE